VKMPSGPHGALRRQVWAGQARVAAGRVERMACIIGGGIGDCFLHLGWIATWSEPGPALVIGAIEEEPFAIWPVAQLLGCAHA
jgi:hypothetical protein